MGKSKQSPPRPYPSLIDRIAANVRPEPAPGWAGVDGPCWIWQGKQNARGYGWISIRKMKFSADGEPIGRKQRNVLVHRLVLSLSGIPWHEIPVGAHLCSTKLCCNPYHLDAQTPEENREHYLKFERAMKAVSSSG